MKKYKFDLTKYFDDNELSSIALVLDDFLETFNKDGVANLDIKDDVHVTMKVGEGAVFHLVLDNDDMFTGLPKKLAQPKKIANFVISKMEDAVKQTSAVANAVKAKADLEAKAEDNLLSYMGATKDTPAPAEEKTSKTTVTVNGKEVTDPDEKQKVINDLTNDYREFLAKFNEATAKFNKGFVSDFFNHFFE